MGKDETNAPCPSQKNINSGSSSASEAQDPYKVMVHCHDKLVTALSSDPQSVANTLVAKGFIPPNISEIMHLNIIPQEKATILVEAIRGQIKIAPRRFHEFVNILKDDKWTENIAAILLSTYRGGRSSQ